MANETGPPGNREVGLEQPGPQGVAARVDCTHVEDTLWVLEQRDTAEALGDGQAQGQGMHQAPGPAGHVVGWPPLFCSLVVCGRVRSSRDRPAGGKTGVSPFWCWKGPGRLPTGGLAALPGVPPANCS